MKCLQRGMDWAFNPFQSRDTIWYHTFNAVLHMLQGWKGLTLSSPKTLWHMKDRIKSMMSHGITGLERVK
jgi:hypothetical protein